MMKNKLIKTDGTYILSVNEYKDEVFAIADTNKAYELNKHKLSLKNCQAIENGYDLDELTEIAFPPLGNCDVDLFMTQLDRSRQRASFIKGFQKALSILGDKKFSEDELKLAFFHVQNEPTFDVFKESLQQTEFDVEIEMEPYVKYVPKSLATVFPTGGVRPKLDADKCLILKRK